MTEPSLAERAAQRAVDSRVRTSEQDVRRLLDVGLTLMVEGGTHAPPRVADIIRAAGLSNQAFYKYFASRDDLVAAVIDDGERRLVASVQRRLAAARGQHVLKAFVSAVTSQAADPAVAAATRAVLRNSGRSLGLGGVRSRQLHELLADVLASALERLGSTDPARDAAVITGAVTSFMLDHLWQESAPGPQGVRHLLAFCERGMTRT